ncbi:MAG: bifunctional riboflavin kinase/FAD synthetase [Clostridia bacterium]|nr:MAG: bifunctional riboflavin kinase/FAD synthetase [Clostridia bacterium]
MRILDNLGVFDLPGAAVALGNFDGVHLGHQRLVREMVSRARSLGRPAVVVSFSPHPMQVLGREPFSLILTPERKAAMLERLGADCLLCLPFTLEMAQVKAEDFVTEVLMRPIRPRVVVVGFNFTFGYRGTGTPAMLERLGRGLGFATVVIPPVEVDGQPVSSSRIREILSRGQVAEARAALGYWPLLEGRVVSGRAVGREIGFPTANLAVPEQVLLPADGVYAVKVRVNGRSLGGVLNIGVRPTFGDGQRTVEVYLLDFSGDLYGAHLVIELRARLRAERRLSGPEELARQIAADVEQARAALASDSDSE